VGGGGDDFLLRQLTRQSLFPRNSGISGAGDAHGLIDVRAAGQGVADCSAQAGGRAAERFDFSGMVVGLVFEHQKPFFFNAVDVHVDFHRAGVDFLAFVQIF